MDVIVVGGRGTVGKHVCSELAARGHRAVVLGRGDRLADARGEAIVHCAGASVVMGLGHGWRGYGAVDVPLGVEVAARARQLRARVVYVAAANGPAHASCAYVRAHERVAAALGELDSCVVRATGFHAAFAALLPFARRGWLVDVGDGRALTNPIDERDLATICVDALLGRERSISAGGPEVLTRAQLFEIIAAAAGRRVRTVRVPAWLAALGAPALRIAHPRIGQFAQFALALARHDNVAPALGTRRLEDYLGSASTRARKAG
jgi:uncharacterized protein YbjT (DUF2867 family)